MSPDQRVHVGDFRPQRLPPREGEQAADQIGAADRPVERLGAQLGRCRIVLDQPLQQIEVADDDAEHVVEVVRHAAGEVADRLHLLRLRELALDQPAFGDVLHGAGDAADDAVLVRHRPAFDAQQRAPRRPAGSSWHRACRCSCPAIRSAIQRRAAG